jgi:hypothetical protein
MLYSLICALDVALSSTWTTPKIDWTPSDYYNYSDLDRVESNTEYLKDELESIGYEPNISTLVTSRNYTDLVFFDVMNRIEGNIKSLADCSYNPLGWKNPKVDWASVIDNFDYNVANRLESNLINLKEMINDIKEETLFCGTYYCGDTFGNIFSDWGCL